VVRVGDPHGSNPNLNPNHNYRKRTTYYKIKIKSIEDLDDMFVHGSTQWFPSRASTSGSQESRVFPAGEQRHVGVHPSNHRLILIVAYGSHVAVAGLHARRDAGTRLQAPGPVLFALPTLHAAVPSEDEE